LDKGLTAMTGRGYAVRAMSRRQDGPESETPRQEQVRQVAQLVRAARRRAGLTQAGLAHRMTQLGEKTTRSQVSMWETSRLPNAFKLIRLVHAAASMPQTHGEGDRALDDLLDAFRDLGRPPASPGRSPGRRRDD
jgi:DNA-binding transcriptional regulator YiaG